MALTREIVYTPRDSLITRQPLKYGGNGREQTRNIVIDPATVAADARGIKSLYAGTLMLKMTSGANAGAFGPYSASATDGRQTLVNAPDACILVSDVNLTVDPVNGTHKPVETGAYTAYCDFNFSQLTVNGVTITALRAAFPTCTVWAS